MDGFRCFLTKLIFRKLVFEERCLSEQRRFCLAVERLSQLSLCPALQILSENDTVNIDSLLYRATQCIVLDVVRT